MTKKQFLHFCQTYGSALQRWPEDVRASAHEFMQTHPDLARPMLEAEKDVDSALAKAPRQEVRPALSAQILQSFRAETQSQTVNTAPPRHGSLFNLLWPQNHGLPAWGMALALILVFGFVGGYTGYAYTLNRTSATDVLSTAFGNDGDSLFGEENTT
ncbi:MAG: hypothetical protein Q9M33_02730 [Robiginitomaculum sp.]|nr:hypothetical protein [Robiginitomaculum sp.]MDQ7077292.1 hypothetical protein [Robiginitomaculum sp.]